MVVSWDHYCFDHMFAVNALNYDTYGIWTSLKMVLTLLKCQPLPTFEKLMALTINKLLSVKR
jgi:hypothetical protein